ncbi:cold-shock protein [Domibacillus indicus]|uniref:cold-shock protein n=1 Tax=Domibacillus indicus TaxID=1437523 RepID=UPI000617C92E|nr:cold shock domain-containing protein [Domibacillus indicus]
MVGYSFPAKMTKSALSLYPGVKFKKLEANDTVEFSIKEGARGWAATNVVVIQRNAVKHHTEDKFAWCREGEQLEEAFVREIVPKIGRNLIIHPDKISNPTSIDLFNPQTQEISDLKTQKTPFFTANKYNYEPTYTVTFNRKDYTRYKQMYPRAIIYWYVKWEQTEWNGLSVEPLEGVWEVTFHNLALEIEKGKVPLHPYQNRVNDDQNAKDSYLFDLRNFTRLL